MSNESSDAGVRSYVRAAITNLEAGKTELAQNHLFDAKEHLERELTDCHNTLDALSK